MRASGSSIWTNPKWRRILGKFDQVVGQHPEVWKPRANDHTAVANRVGADWARMGDNAWRCRTSPTFPSSSAVLRDHPDRPRPLRRRRRVLSPQPGAAPDRLQGYLDLVEFHDRRKELKKAEQAARDCSERFSDHGPTKETSAICAGWETIRRRLAVAARSVRGEPTGSSCASTKPGSRFSCAAACRGRRFDEARADYQAARFSAVAKRTPVSFACGRVRIQSRARSKPSTPRAAGAGGGVPLGLPIASGCGDSVETGKTLKSRFRPSYRG